LAGQRWLAVLLGGFIQAGLEVAEKTPKIKLDLLLSLLY
jgi:hypothetical protein